MASEGGQSSNFNALANINGNDWTDELYDLTPSEIKESFNNAIRFVIDSDDNTFKNNLCDYFDVQSLIDYFIFAYVVNHWDGLEKNQIYTTYDGVKWFMNAYDMDTTVGKWWTGDTFLSHDYMDIGLNNKLYTRLKDNFGDEINKRYEYLVKNELSVENMINNYERLAETSLHLMSEDYEIFPGIPAKINHIKQIREYLTKRKPIIDDFMKSLKSPIRCESIILDKNSYIFETADPIQLNATVVPIDTSESVIWTSSNKEVAIIDNKGLVTPVSLGECIITARCGNCEAYCNIINNVENGNSESLLPAEIPVEDLILFVDSKNKSNESDNKEIWEDLSGKGNDLALIGFDFETCGWFNNGLKCNGTSSYLRLVDNSKFDLNTSEDITILFMIKGTAINCVSKGFMYSSNWGNGLALYYYKNEGLEYKVGSSPSIKKGLSNDTTGNNILHMAMQRSNKTSKLNYNNAFAGSNSSDYPILKDGVRFMCGGSKDNVGEFADGTIYSIAIYNRALTEEEMSAIYNYQISLINN